MNLRTKKCFMCMLLAIVQLFALSSGAFAAEQNETGEPKIYAKMDFTDQSKDTGMSLVNSQHAYVERAGRIGVLLDRERGNESFMLFNVNDGMAYEIPNGTPIEVRVDYFDEGNGFFVLAYDAYDAPNLFFNGIWSYTEVVPLTNTMEWKSYTFYTEKMQMTNRADGADFRIGLFEFDRGTSVSNAIIGSVELEQVDCREQLRLVSVEGNEYGNIYSKDEEIGMRLNFANKTVRQLEGDFTYTAKDSSGNIMSEGSFSEVFPVGETVSVELEPKADKYGIYTITINGNLVYSDDKAMEPIQYSTEAEYSLAWKVSEENINDRYGTALLIPTYQWSAGNGVAADIATDAGLRWNREEIQWKEVEKSPGVYEIPEEKMRELRLAKEAGMNVEIGLLYANPVCYDTFLNDNDVPTTAQEMEAFGNWCEWMARETRGVVDAFGTWNEVNAGVWNTGNDTPEHFAKVMELMYTSVKKGNPDALILGPETTGIDPAFTEKVFAAGGLNFIDAVSVHYYDTSGHFNTQKLMDQCNELKALIEKYGEGEKKNTPIWFTEFGFGTVIYTPEEQASNFVMAYALEQCFDLVDVSFQFRMQDDLLIPQHHESEWGLIRHYTDTGRKNGAKPSYLALCAMNNLIGIRADAKDVIQDGTTYAFRFYNNEMGKDVALLMGEYDQNLMTLDFGTNSVEIYDMYGNKINTTVSDNGVYSFHVNKVPFYAVGNFKKFEQVSNENAKIIPVDFENAVLPGDPTTYTFKNMTGRKLKIEAEESELIHVEKNDASKDNTVSVTLRTSAELKDRTSFYLSVVDEQGNAVYTGRHIAVPSEPVDVAITPEHTTDGTAHWRAKVDITNYSVENAVSGTFEVLSPETEAQFIKPRRISTIAPKETFTFYMNLPHCIINKDYDLTAQLTLDTGFEKIIKQHMDFTTAQYAVKKPKIDGVVDKGEWTGSWFGADDILHYGSDAYSWDKVWNGADDASFVGTTMWDEENFYLFVQAKDDVHFIEYDGGTSNMWRADSIQFGITDIGYINGGQNSFTEIAVGDVPDRGAIAYRFTSHYGLLSAQYGSVTASAEMENCELAVKRYDGYTIYECAFPWPELMKEGYVPYDGQKMNFSVALNDADSKGVRGWIMYNGGITPGKNVNLFGVMTLEK